MAAATAAVAASVALCSASFAAAWLGWLFRFGCTSLLVAAAGTGSLVAGARFAARLGTATARRFGGSLTAGAEELGATGAWDAAGARAAAMLGLDSTGRVGALGAGGVGFF